MPFSGSPLRPSRSPAPSSWHGARNQRGSVGRRFPSSRHRIFKMATPQQPQRPSKAKLASEVEARDVAEAARESEWSGASFVRELFLGRFPLELIHPYPESDPEEEKRAAPFMKKLREFLVRVD